MKFKEQPTFAEVIGSIAFIGAMIGLGVTVLVPVLSHGLTPEATNNMAIQAQTGLLAISAAGAGFYLRGKVQNPGDTGGPGVTVNAQGRESVQVDATTSAPAAPPAPAPAPTPAPLAVTLANVGPVAALPVQHTSRGLQGQHVERGQVPTVQRVDAEGGTDQRGAPA